MIFNTYSSNLQTAFIFLLLAAYTQTTQAFLQSGGPWKQVLQQTTATISPGAIAQDKPTPPVILNKIGDYSTSALSIFDPPGIQEDTLPNRIKAKIPNNAVKIPLSYDHIQGMIDVSRPYYNLHSEQVVYNEMGVPAGFMCGVNAEMPLGREGGVMSSGEADRHMAIAGSIAAALSNTKDGKHYYLALDVEFQQDPTSGEFEEIDMMSGSKIFARCLKMEKRKATCEIFLQSETGEQYASLKVTYAIMSPKMFCKMNPPPTAALSLTNKDTLSLTFPAASDIEIKAPSSPYRTFNGLPTRANKIRSGQFDVELPLIAAKQCAGHFDGNPALPIAILCSHISDLVGETISDLANVDLPKKETRGRDDNHHAASCNNIVMGEVAVKTSKLIQAESEGLYMSCSAMLRDGGMGKDGSDYEVLVKVRSMDDAETPLCTYSAIVSLNRTD